MLGFRLMIWGFTALLRRLPQLIYISILPMLFIAATMFGLNEYVSGQLNPGSGGILVVFVYVVLPLPAISWAAVHWGRLMVHGVQPWPFPRAKIGHVWGHMWRFTAILLGLYSVWALYFYSLDYLFTVLNFFAGNDILLSLISLAFFVLLFIATIVVLMRFSPSFTGVGIGEWVTLRQGWRLAKPYLGTLVVIGCTLLVTLFAAVSVLVLSNSELGLVVLFVLIWWIISIMTEFYAYIRAQNDISEVFG